MEFILKDEEAFKQEEGESPFQGLATPSSTETSSSGTSSPPGSPNLGSGMITPIPMTASSEGTSSGDSSIKDGPRGFRTLYDVYKEARELDLGPEELLLVSAEEPTNYREAATEKEWQEAMKRELESIEKKQTWELVDLPKGH